MKTIINNWLVGMSTGIIFNTIIETGHKWLDWLITIFAEIFTIFLLPLIIGLIKKYFPKLGDNVEDVIEDLKDDGKLNNSNVKETKEEEKDGVDDK